MIIYLKFCLVATILHMVLFYYLSTRGCTLANRIYTEAISIRGFITNVILTPITIIIGTSTYFILMYTLKKQGKTQDEINQMMGKMIKEEED